MSASRPDSVKRSKKASCKRQLLCWCALYIGLISRRRRGGNTQAIKSWLLHGFAIYVSQLLQWARTLNQNEPEGGGNICLYLYINRQARSGSQLYQLGRGPGPWEIINSLLNDVSRMLLVGKYESGSHRPLKGPPVKPWEKLKNSTNTAVLRSTCTIFLLKG